MHLVETVRKGTNRRDNGGASGGDGLCSESRLDEIVCALFFDCSRGARTKFCAACSPEVGMA